MRIVGNKYGAEVLERVVEVHGEKGIWKIVFTEAESSALRKVRVRDAHILTENISPAGSAAAGSLIDLNQLNLDSDGVLATLQKEAGAELPVAALEYRLSSSPDADTPVWTVTWPNPREEKMSVVQISAQSGEVLGRETLPLAASSSGTEDTLTEENSPKKQSATRSPRGIRGRSDILDEVVQNVERPARIVRRILPF